MPSDSLCCYRHFDAKYVHIIHEASPKIKWWNLEKNYPSKKKIAGDGTWTCDLLHLHVVSTSALDHSATAPWCKLYFWAPIRYNYVLSSQKMIHLKKYCQRRDLNQRPSDWYPAQSLRPLGHSTLLDRCFWATILYSINTCKKVVHLKNMTGVGI